MPFCSLQRGRKQKCKASQSKEQGAAKASLKVIGKEKQDKCHGQGTGSNSRQKVVQRARVTSMYGA
jgi:hypothetical protein